MNTSTGIENSEERPPVPLLLSNRRLRDLDSSCRTGTPSPIGGQGKSCSNGGSRAVEAEGGRRRVADDGRASARRKPQAPKTVSCLALRDPPPLGMSAYVQSRERYRELRSQAPWPGGIHRLAMRKISPATERRLRKQVIGPADNAVGWTKQSFPPVWLVERPGECSVGEPQRELDGVVVQQRHSIAYL